MITLQTPYVQFTELDGSPLDDGAVYIGTAGLNPQTNPITVYWDNAGTQPAAQPLTTRSGVIARNGAPARVYISASSYSLMVRDKRGRLLATEPSITADIGTDNITDGAVTISKLESSVASLVNGALQKSGGTMTGKIVLDGDATLALHPVPKQQLDAVAALLDQVCPPGTISPKASLTTPARWLLIDGKTIGNAASGATARANADTARLFEKLWAFPAAAVLIFDSTGAPSVRGASAAADFAAGKRLALFSSDGGGFLRLWAPGQTTDIGRVAGSMQGDAFQGHEHQLFDVRSGGGGGYLGSGSDDWTRNTQQIVQKPGYSPARVADETRPYNLAVPHYIFLGVA